MTTRMLGVEGRSCRHCQAAVGEALRSVPGVETAEVRLEEGRSTVTYDPAQAPFEKLREAVDEAGYRLVEPSLRHPTHIPTSSPTDCDARCQTHLLGAHRCGA